MDTYIDTYIHPYIHVFTYRERKGEGERPGYKHHIYAYSNTHACSQHARRLTISAHTALHTVVYAVVSFT